MVEGVLQDIARARARPRPGGHRPFVTLAYARSLDGCLAHRRGERTRLSGPESLRLTHSLRACHAALVIGVETVLVDDPLLTTRLVPGPSPLRVILDSHLRTPPEARVLSRRAPGVWIACGDDADPERAGRLVRVGARVVHGPRHPRGVDVAGLLVALGRAGVRSVMVEGGARVLASFVRDRLVDFVCVTVAPVEIGGARAVTLAHDPLSEPALGLTIRRFQLGRDTLICGALDPELP
jgi:riboflavin-specific deaminase-like protein